MVVPSSYRPDTRPTRPSRDRSTHQRLRSVASAYTPCLANLTASLSADVEGNAPATVLFVQCQPGYGCQRMSWSSDNEDLPLFVPGSAAIASEQRADLGDPGAGQNLGDRLSATMRRFERLRPDGVTTLEDDRTTTQNGYATSKRRAVGRFQLEAVKNTTLAPEIHPADSSFFNLFLTTSSETDSSLLR